MNFKPINGSLCWKFQLEVAYDMLLIQSLSLQWASKVMDNTIH